MDDKRDDYKKSLDKITKTLKQTAESFKKYKIPSFENLFPNYDEINQRIKEIQNELLKCINIDQLREIENQSKINGRDSHYLKEMYWTIPFEYKYENLESLRNTCKNKHDFESFMKRYHEKSRINRQFSKIRKNIKELDKKILLRQIENAYNNGDYAICITSLITILDGTTMILMDSNSDNKHNSYKIIKVIRNYINEPNEMGLGYEVFLKVTILYNFYKKFYKNRDLIKEKSNELSRHLNSHGSIYLNKKIDVLRLLDALIYTQELIKELDMDNQFIYNKKSNKFDIK